MDAISFVLGVRTAQLRGSHLKDLVHNPSGKPLKDNATASVLLVLHNTGTDDEMHFQRSITAKGDKSEYRIDGKVVSAARYDEQLRALNILVRARNFLVFQVRRALYDENVFRLIVFSRATWKRLHQRRHKTLQQCSKRSLARAN